METMQKYKMTKMLERKCIQNYSWEFQIWLHKKDQISLGLYPTIEKIIFFM